MNLIHELKNSLIEEIDVDIIEMLKKSFSGVDNYNVAFAKKQILNDFFRYDRLLLKVNKNGTHTKYNIMEAVSICLRDDILENIEFGKKIIIFLEEVSEKKELPLRVQLSWNSHHDKIGIHVAEINESSVLDPGDAFIYQ